MRSVFRLIIVLMMLSIGVSYVWAAKSDCGPEPNVPPKPAVKVAKNDPNVQNDYDTVVAENTDPGVVYLALVNGSQPVPNKCGLIPSNPSTEWLGWGGPLDGDNVTIGEGPKTRNPIVIGGVLFERGIGTHGTAKFVYPLTGAQYTKFEGYVGMSDEKDPAECGHGGSSTFKFSIDGKVVFESPVLKGTDGGNEVPPLKVEFDIPAGAKELVIEIGDGGDGISCDHSSLGDAKLFTSLATPVRPNKSISTTWGDIKVSY